MVPSVLFPVLETSRLTYLLPRCGCTKWAEGIRRAKGTAPTQKAAAEIAVIRAMVEHLDTGLQSIRHRAVLLIDFVGAFRRSELAGLVTTAAKVGLCPFASARSDPCYS